MSRDIERDGRLIVEHPLLLEAVSHIAHYQVRNRGAVGGSLAHADGVPRRSLFVALVVGTLLNFINQGDALLGADRSAGSSWF